MGGHRSLWAAVRQYLPIIHDVQRPPASLSNVNTEADTRCVGHISVCVQTAGSAPTAPAVPAAPFTHTHVKLAQLVRIN